jgi:maleylacetoacetate isomerase/maleylpyruvate isomerase
MQLEEIIMADFTLYNYFRSSTSYRARVALGLKGVAFEYKAVNILKGEHHLPEYRKLNPLGGVPTLIHKGLVIPDSAAILEYLEEIIQHDPLLPKDSYTRARIRQFCEIINSGMHPLGNLKVQKYLGEKHGYDLAQKEEWFGIWAHEGLQALEITLKEFAGEYSFGNQVTLADVYLAPQILTCQRFKVSLEKYPTVARVNENCLKLEAFQKAHPFVQIDTPEEFRKK